ncbi:MAG: glycosyltransferase family 4 protein [Methanobacteriota archaeon]
MKICILSEFSVSPYMEGTNRVTLGLSRELTKQGHTVHIVSPAWGQDKTLTNEVYEIDGIKIHIFKAPFLNNPIFRIIFYIINGIKIYFKHDVDVFYGTYTLPPAIAASALGLMLRKKRYAAIYEPAACSRTNNPIVKFLLSKLSGVVTHTNTVKRMIVANFGIPEESIAIIPGFYDAVRFRPMEKNKELVAKHNLNKKFVVLFVGRITALKGVQYLIDAISLIKNEKLKLLLVGREVEHENFRNTVEKLNLENIIEFVGYVPDEELPKYYSVADCVVLPSLSEGFGIVLAEAMASKKPVIASDTLPLPEVVGEGGIIVPAKDSKKLSAAIQILMQNRKLREEIAEKAIERAQEFNSEIILSTHAKFLTV